MNNKTVLEHLEDVVEGKHIDSDTMVALAEHMKRLHEAYPFKTVHVPKHLLDEFNEGREKQTVQMHFTVAKDAVVTEDDIRSFLKQMDKIRENARPMNLEELDGPPHTGREKTKLGD